ncbi:exported hypothetical protein [Gammaproteobacteria bacterium]
MRRSVIAIALPIALLAMPTVQASDFSGIYITGKLGINNSQMSGINNTNSKNSPTYGFEEGYNWDKSGFLVGVDFFLDMNQKTTHTLVGSPDLNYGSNAMGLDAKLGLPITNLMPYVKLGLTRITGMGVYPVTKFKYGVDLHLGLGLEYKLSPTWSAVGELTKATNKADSDKLSNENFTLGITYYLGAP